VSFQAEGQDMVRNFGQPNQEYVLTMGAAEVEELVASGAIAPWGSDGYNSLLAAEDAREASQHRP
jgi:hypothetical protein